MHLYEYDPLDLGRPAIRLVRLLPGSDSTPILCEIFRAFLYQEEEIIPYEALSYTWGSAAAPEHIVVNGRMLAVTRNLHQALQQLHGKDQDRILWIDAICINQSNEKERGHQVQQMGEIFKQADRVLFYLGESTMEVDTFMDTLNIMGKLSLNYPSRKWSSDDERWEFVWTSAIKAILGNPSPRQVTTLQQGYRDLLERPWFRRVWILQEVTNARAALVCCGLKTVKPWLLKVLQKLLDITPDDHCQAVLDIMPGPWRQSSWWNKSQGLYTLLTRFGGSEATEPHDVIYALRGMSSDAKHSPSLYPDYTKSEQELVRDTILFLYPLKDEDLAKLRLPMTIHELVSKLGYLGLRIYSIIFRKTDKENQGSLTGLSHTQIWDLVSPDRIQELHSPSRMRDLHSPSEMRSRLLLALLQSDRTGDAMALFRFWRSEDKVRTEHLIAAAENIHGIRALEIIFDVLDPEFNITEEVLVSAAKNKDHGDKMMELLLQHPGYQLPITDSVVMTAVENAGCGNGIIKALVKYENSQLPIAEDILCPGR
ncbi:heterokaryon incompatibility domain-containing protein [Trichoderma evansii]